MLFTKLFCVCNFELKKLCTLKIFIVSVCYINSPIPHTAILTTFRELMPATTHFIILGFKPENFENN